MAESARQKRLRELGVISSTSSPSISTREQRKIELGVSTPAPAPAIRELSSRERRKIELGVSQDTRLTDSYAEYSKTHNQFATDKLNIAAPIVTPKHEQSGWNGVIDNPIIRGAVNTIKAIDKNVTAFQDAGANALTFGLNNKLAQRLGQDESIDNQHSVAGKIGEVTGDLVGISKLYKGGAALTKTLLPNAGKLAKLIVPGLAAGAGYQTAKEAVDMAMPDQLGLNDIMNPNGIPQIETLAHRGGDIAKSAALFAGGDVALRYAGKGIKALSDASGLTPKLKGAITSFISKVRPEIKEPITTYPNPTRLKVAGTEDAFTAVIPKVFEKATERMTPPLENPKELAKWVRNHLNNDGHEISLNEVKQLDYEGLRELAEEMRSKINIEGLVQKTAHDMGYGNIYEGIPAPIKERIAYDAQSRVYGVPAPNVKITRNVPNERTFVNPNDAIKAAEEAKAAEATKSFVNPNEIVSGRSSKADQATSPNGIRTDGLTIMEKYFPDGKIDTKILAQLPLEERLRFQSEQTPGYKKPVTLDSRGLPSDASHLKNTPDYLREEIGRNNAIAEDLGLADDIEELFAQGLTSKEVRQKLTYKLPGDYNEAKAVVESVRSFRGIPSSSQKPEFEAWLKTRELNPQAPAKMNESAELNAMDRNPKNTHGDEGDVQTAEPRISSKVSGYLEEEIAAASERIKAKNYTGPNEIIKNGDHALIGVTYIEKGTRRLSDFTEQMVREFGEEVRPQIREIFKQSKQIFKDTELRVSKDLQGLEGIEPSFLRDTSGFTHVTSDIYRVFKNVFKDKFPQMKKAILDPLDAAKHENVKMQEEWLNKMHTEVVEKLGIDKGSKLSALVQRFGEKDIDLLQLQKLAPKDWEKVVEADKFFRNAYDTLIDKVNATRARIYPNNPDKIVPKRDDYYRHFQEFSSLTGLKNIFDTPAGIDPHLVGVSETTLPKSKFAGFMQKRGLGKFKNDAVGGFLEYLPGASYATHIDPQIDVFKNLAKNIVSETEKTENLNQFIKFLQEYSQDLAGKTNKYDRLLQDDMPGGRKAFKVINWVNSRVKSNTILGNVASTIAQIANIPTGIAFAKQYAIKGAGKTLLTAIKGNPLHEESQFLKERYFDKNYRKFDTRWLDTSNPLKLKNAASWALETSDRMGTEFIWNSAYEKGLKKGIENPVKYADDETRRLVAGRGIGEVPLLQKSKIFQIFAPFTLEVANLWRVQKDFIKAKDFGGMALLMLGAYAFNKVAEEVKGSGVVFDPIQAMVEASADGLSPMERAGRIAGEVVSNIPLGGTVASAYPENGDHFFGLEKIFGNLPTRKELFGDNDPTRFGSGIIARNGLEDPLFKLLPGFGGNQVKKTIDGVKSIANEGSYVGDKLKTPIEMNPVKAAQAVAFGSNATKEMQTYFDEKRRPLSEKQTQQYESLSGADRVEYYKSLLQQRKVDSLKAQAKKVSDNEDMTAAEKQKQIDKLLKTYYEAIGQAK